MFFIEIDLNFPCFLQIKLSEFPSASVSIHLHSPIYPVCSLRLTDNVTMFQGPAVVVVSCVTHDNDPSPRAHPHNLVSPASVSRVSTIFIWSDFDSW